MATRLRCMAKGAAARGQILIELNGGSGFSTTGLASNASPPPTPRGPSAMPLQIAILLSRYLPTLPGQLRH